MSAVLAAAVGHKLEGLTHAVLGHLFFGLAQLAELGGQNTEGCHCGGVALAEAAALEF